MAVPKKVDGRWQHRVMVKGVRSSGTFDTKAAALAWEASVRTTKAQTGATTQTCRDAFDRYAREVSPGKKGEKWEVLRLAAIGRTALGDIRMRDVNASHVAAWRDERIKPTDPGVRAVQGSTVQREMNLLSNVFAVARKEWKWITASPTTDVRRPKENKPRFRRITDEEIEHICHALGWLNKEPTTKQQRIAAAFLFAIETAMRAGEICALEPADVVGRVARVRDSKTGEGRDVPLSPRAQEIWKLVPKGFDITPKSLDAMFRVAKKERTTIENLTFHDTRHEAITRLAKKLHVLDLARVVGHKDLRRLMVYYNLSAEDIADKL